MTAAIVILTASALPLARLAADAIGDAEINGLRRRCPDCDIAFDDTLDHIRRQFQAGRPVVGICAAGILIRAVAPVLGDKRDEPPVIAVAEDGSAVVPLLGGHHDGNALSARIAEALGVAAAVTTAGDARFGIALDDPPTGWTLSNPQDAKPVMAQLLSGASAGLAGDAPWLADSDLPLADDGEIALVVTEKTDDGGPDRLVYHPHVLAIGVGCERGCAPEELDDLVGSVLARYGLARAAIALIASIDLKADEAAVHALAGTLGVPARFFGADEIEAVADRIANPSEIVRREVGVAGVAEGAALAAGGRDGELIVEKTKSKRATCAIVRASAPIDAASVGRARGRVSLVGLGPGSLDWRSPQATRLLQDASDWVGYGLYLDLAADLLEGQRSHRFDLGEEEARVRHALELAGEGRDVALVCSGDAGIYAMAALAFELIDEAAGARRVSPAARRAEITVAPGISAFQAAAALAGAPIGHDFCAISLSDLLTPWAAIENRLRAAAAGDFVVALYNPRSRKRRDQLDTAIAILRAERPGETPVVIASELGRPKQSVRMVALSDFDPDEVDMLTVVLIGSSTSRMIETGEGRRVAYTPRGYDKKAERAVS